MSAESDRVVVVFKVYQTEISFNLPVSSLPISLFLVLLVMPCAQDGSILPDLRIVLGNWLAFAMIGNPRVAGGTGIVRGTELEAQLHEVIG